MATIKVCDRCKDIIEGRCHVMTITGVMMQTDGKGMPTEWTDLSKELCPSCARECFDLVTERKAPKKEIPRDSGSYQPGDYQRGPH